MSNAKFKSSRGLSALAVALAMASLAATSQAADTEKTKTTSTSTLTIQQQSTIKNSSKQVSLQNSVKASTDVPDSKSSKVTTTTPQLGQLPNSRETSTNKGLSEKSSDGLKAAGQIDRIQTPVLGASDSGKANFNQGFQGKPETIGSERAAEATAGVRADGYKSLVGGGGSQITEKDSSASNGIASQGTGAVSGGFLDAIKDLLSGPKRNGDEFLRDEDAPKEDKPEDKPDEEKPDGEKPNAGMPLLDGQPRPSAEALAKRLNDPNYKIKKDAKENGNINPDRNDNSTTSGPRVGTVTTGTQQKLKLVGNPGAAGSVNVVSGGKGLDFNNKNVGAIDLGPDTVHTTSGGRQQDRAGDTLGRIQTGTNISASGRSAEDEDEDEEENTSTK